MESLESCSVMHLLHWQRLFEISLFNPLTRIFVLFNIPCSDENSKRITRSPTQRSQTVLKVKLLGFFRLTLLLFRPYNGK